LTKRGVEEGPRTGRRARKGPLGLLLAPFTAVLAVAARLATSVSRGGSALSHEPASAVGREAANLLGHEAATATATAAVGGAGATGAAAAGAATSPASPGTPALALTVGGVATAAVAVAVAVATLSGGDPEPEEAAPTTTTTIAAPVEQPSSGPGQFSATPANVTAGNLLAGADFGTSGGTIAIVGVEGSSGGIGAPLALPSGATVTVAADGSFEYDPGDAFLELAADQTATDQFTYTVTDGEGFTAEWTATISIVGVNNGPAIDPVGPVSVNEESSTTVALIASDPDSSGLSFELAEPVPPFVSLVDGGDGTAVLQVQPGQGQAGSYELTVTVLDSGSPPLTDSVAVTITVVAKDAPPLGRVTEGLQVLYHFDEGAGGVISDSAGAGSPYDLTVADPDAVRWINGSLAIEAPTILIAERPASKVSEAAIASNGITLEAWVTPTLVSGDALAGGAQSGPARIVSVSADIVQRNATLAQGDPENIVGDHWTARVRSTETSPNGLPALSTPAGSVIADRLTHLVFTRSADGVTTLYVDGAVAATGTAAGDLSGWDPSFRLMLANEATGERPWLGTYHLVAVYGRALSPAEVGRNHGVGA